MSGDPIYDVIAVNLKTARVRILAPARTQKQADATVTMAVVRRGNDEEYFEAVPAGTVKDGEVRG